MPDPKKAAEEAARAKRDVKVIDAATEVFFGPVAGRGVNSFTEDMSKYYQRATVPEREDSNAAALMSNIVAGVPGVIVSESAGLGGRLGRFLDRREAAAEEAERAPAPRTPHTPTGSVRRAFVYDPPQTAEVYTASYPINGQVEYSNGPQVIDARGAPGVHVVDARGSPTPEQQAASAQYLAQAQAASAPSPASRLSAIREHAMRAAGFLRGGGR